MSSCSPAEYDNRSKQLQTTHPLSRLQHPSQGLSSSRALTSIPHSSSSSTFKKPHIQLPLNPDSKHNSLPSFPTVSPSTSAHPRYAGKQCHSIRLILNLNQPSTSPAPAILSEDLILAISLSSFRQRFEPVANALYDHRLISACHTLGLRQPNDSIHGRLIGRHRHELLSDFF